MNNGTVDPHLDSFAATPSSSSTSTSTSILSFHGKLIGFEPVRFFSSHSDLSHPQTTSNSENNLPAPEPAAVEEDPNNRAELYDEDNNQVIQINNPIRKRRREGNDCCDIDLKRGKKTLQLASGSGSDTGSSFGENELLPEEIVMSFDHILQQVFQSLKVNDLLNCRLVSHRWNSLATFYLQKNLKLEFVVSNFHMRFRRFVGPFQEHFLQETSPSIPFPCRKFSLKICCGSPVEFLSGQYLQIFLKVHGARIIELSISVSVTTGGSSIRCSSNNVLHDQIRNFLLEQSPNIRSLTFKIDSKFSILKYNSIMNAGSFNSNLRLLTFPNEVSLEILEAIISLSPRLEEIKVGEDNYISLLEPINRLSFLKVLSFHPRTVKSMDNFEKIVTVCETGGLKLREIFICLPHYAFEPRPTNLFQSSQMICRAVSVINKLLACSWDSLESVEWLGVTFLHGLKPPPVMPKLVTLDLGSPHNLCGQSAWPPGFLWSETFPNLKCVKFYYDLYLETFTDFIGSLSVKVRGKLNCVDSVKKVEIKSRHSISSTDLEEVHALFPCAEVTVLYLSG